MNGDMPVKEYYGYCKYCGEYVHESYPREIDPETGDYICIKCAYTEGLWNEEDLGHVFHCKRAAVKDDVFYLTNKKFPWEKTKKQQRHTPEYIRWRTEVFERDKYTCAICGQVGGELNAHHIRPFKDYPELRLSLNNGVTLCKECHKRVHKEKDSEWLHPIEQRTTGKQHMEQATNVCESVDISADECEL